MSTLLAVDRISKTFTVGTFGGAKVPAVRGVSFEIGAGELVSLIGESGSGKTTIGRLILGLARPTSGTISFEGRDVSRLEGGALRGYYRHVQGVFQDPFSSYNPVFRVDHAFALLRGTFLGNLSKSEWQAKLCAAIEDVSLEPSAVLGKYPHQLSGGQLQRLLIARALLLDIRLLVADEIISMLDASTRVDVLNLLADLKQRGLGVLFVTHDLSLGNYISERTVILRRGAIVEMGATEKVFSAPCHPYTRMLLASVPTLGERWGSAEYAEAASVGAAGMDAADGAPLVEIDRDHWVAGGRTPG